LQIFPRLGRFLFRSPQGGRCFEERAQVVQPLLFLECLVDEGDQFGHVEWLEQISRRAVPDAFHRRLQTAIAGNDDDFDVGVVLLDVLQQIDSLAVGQFLIEGDEVDMLIFEDPEGGFGVVGGVDGEERAKNDFEGVPWAGLIIDDQYRRFRAYVFR